MGSTESKNKIEEQDESLSRLKHRIQYIKLAISTRKAFFVAFTSYASCLKNTGAALADGNRPSSVDFLLPPPPPPPPPLPPLPPPQMGDDLDLEAQELATNISHSSNPGSLQPVQDGLDWEYFFPTLKDVVVADLDYSVQDDDVEEEEKLEEIVDLPMRMRALIKKRYADIGRKVSEPVSLKQILLDLYHHFLKAFDSTLAVSRILEATSLHYYSNFADNRANGHIDHNRINDLISWDQSFEGSEDDDLNVEEIESIATVLDMMLAWENKLLDELNIGCGSHQI